MERKGAGYPDTLADGVAEAISRAYSRYCMDNFCAVLHHNTDKTALLGGASEVSFGHGEMTAPITALVNGRLTPALGGHIIPVGEIIDATVREFLGTALPLLDTTAHVVVQPRVSHAASPGAVLGADCRAAGGPPLLVRPAHPGRPGLAAPHVRQRHPGGHRVRALGIAERLATSIEAHLTSPAAAAAHPWYGTDVKLMIVRDGQQVHLTACVPQIAARTPDLNAYISRRDQARQMIAGLAAELVPGCAIDVGVNTRDNDARRELYLTAIGSSIESGDEGVVGRGNCANGLISMLRPMSMEGVSGKNPVYHVGKLYNLAAQRAAEERHQLTGRTFTVALVSQSGRDLDDPWQVIAHASGPGAVDPALVRQVVGGVMSDLDDIRAGLLAGKVATA